MKALDQLTPPQLQALQQDLSALGFYQGNPDGLLGPLTVAAWTAASAGDFSALDEAHVRRVQVVLHNSGFYTGAIDGLVGPQTRQAWKSGNPLSKYGVDAQAVPDQRLAHVDGNFVDDPMSPKSVALILRYEGMDQPFAWPGGASGITIGIGYDLGYYTEAEFRSNWGSYLSSDQLNRLSHAIGKTGGAARAMASDFVGIKIDHAAASAVFEKCTLPKFEKQAEGAFPGMNVLPADAEGALVSLVFNRGPSVNGPRRQEMKNIQTLIKNFDSATGDLKLLQSNIADQIHDMKHLWVGAGLDGLLARRDAEAALVRNAA